MCHQPYLELLQLLRGEDHLFVAHIQACRPNFCLRATSPLFGRRLQCPGSWAPVYGQIVLPWLSPAHPPCHPTALGGVRGLRLQLSTLDRSLVVSTGGEQGSGRSRSTSLRAEAATARTQAPERLRGAQQSSPSRFCGLGLTACPFQDTVSWR